jgi:hypothetical protein
MNERIKQLALQAGFEFDDDLSLDPEPIYYTTQKDLQKFAELIIRECLNIIENEAVQYDEPVWAVELVNDITEHFGVEE